MKCRRKWFTCQQTSISWYTCTVCVIRLCKSTLCSAGLLWSSMLSSTLLFTVVITASVSATVDVVNSSLQLSRAAGDAVDDVSQCVLESSISLTADSPPIIAGRHPTPLPVSIATIQLLSAGWLAGDRRTAGSAAVRLSALCCIRLWSPLCELSRSIRPTGTQRDGQAGSPAPGRGRWSEDNSSHRQRVLAATLDCMATGPSSTTVKHTTKLHGSRLIIDPAK